MGKPAGAPVLTCTHTCNRSVPVSTGTGLVMGTKFGTCTHTHSGFDPWVCPVGTRVVRVVLGKPGMAGRVLSTRGQWQESS